MIFYHRYKFHNLKSLRAITYVKDEMLSTFRENRHVLSCSFINLFDLLIKRMILLAACRVSSCPMRGGRCVND